MATEESEEVISLLRSIDQEKNVKVNDARDGDDKEKKSKPAVVNMLAINNMKGVYYANTEKAAYYKVELNGNDEVIRTDSSEFKNWLIYLYARSGYGNGMLSDADIRTAINSLNATAFFRGKHTEVHLRIAEIGDKIYLDLCNEKRQVLEITKEGVDLLDESPIIFRRPMDLDKLPIPIMENAQDYMRLMKYLNFGHLEDFNMIVAYLLSTFRPSIPKPLLCLSGEAGSGKSVNTRVIRKFIDPAKEKDLLKKEINSEEITLAASSQYLLAFDNLSGISKEGSDILCVVSTGGVTTQRKLYTNSEEVIVNLKKTVILNGIDEIAKRQDLVSRTIFVETPVLTDAQKKTEREIWLEFEKDYPYIFGALLMALVEGLKNEGRDKTKYPRLQDFGKFIGGCTETLGWEDGYWQTIYLNNQDKGIEKNIDSDPFASALVEMMEEFREQHLYFWKGTASDLLDKLGRKVSLEIIRSTAWPKSNVVKPRLKRISPSLRARGITWDDKERDKKNRYITIYIESDGKG